MIQNTFWFKQQHEEDWRGMTCSPAIGESKLTINNQIADGKSSRNDGMLIPRWISFLGGWAQFLEGSHLICEFWMNMFRKPSHQPSRHGPRCRRHLLFRLNACPSCRTAPAGCSWHYPHLKCFFCWFAFNHLFCPPSHGEILNPWLPRWRDERLVIGPGSGPRNSTTLGVPKGRLNTL